ncbi:ribonuclease Z, mitochondrial-like [Oppia nitens]|uniref:ribonuclease Z, mitochondrial-like n=1 Tax=Oppia nitens TaxID=1686743 RepID=UPI0023DBC131|nr:ribonuclease Z, mitochondrial-like [Oppia nitens]
MKINLYYCLLRGLTLKTAVNYRQLWTKSGDNNNTSTTTSAVSALHVLGNGSAGNPCSVCLASDDRLYLFNCGQGLQRFLPQYRIKAVKCENLFLTSNYWHNISGISGLLLTQIDSGIKRFTIHTNDSQKLLDLIRYFDVKLDNCQLSAVDYYQSDPTTDTIFTDSYVEIRPIVVNIGDRKTDRTVVYFCKVNRKAGQLLLDKCFHMKIPRNLLPKLKSGETLELDNGLIVRPSDVMTAEEPEQSFVILECQSLEVLNSILLNDKFLLDLNENIQTIECVVHMTPDFLMKSHEYQSLISLFRSETKHLILNEMNPSFGLISLHRTQSQLHSLDEKIFPLINENIDYNKNVINLYNNNNNINENLISCQTGLQYVFRPLGQRGVSFDGLELVSMKFIREDALLDHLKNERQGLAESISDLKAKQQLLESQSNNNNVSEDKQYPEIVFLGTSSAQPLLNRNVSAILLNITDESSILLDCGEDTSGQLYRFYGSQHMNSYFYQKLKAIFVSHIHTDHHMGLIQLIKDSYKYTNKPLTIFIPPMVNDWLNQYNREFEDISHQYVCLATTELCDKDITSVLSDLRLNRLEAIPVVHCLDSFGVLLETIDGNKRIVYSGDAEPTDQLIDRGQGCDLLIHEATQDDSLVPLARKQCHSTVSEAIDVGRRMSAKFTILTHFSARFGKMPLIPDNVFDDNNGRLGIAYDFMRVSLNQLNRLPILLPTLRCLYSSHLSKMVDRSEIYHRRYKIVSVWCAIKDEEVIASIFLTQSVTLEVYKTQITETFSATIPRKRLANNHWF